MKLGPQMEGIHYCANRSEFADLAVLNIVANFCQCLPVIVSKLLTQDTNQNLSKAS